jgi:hypothetical protein
LSPIPTWEVKRVFKHRSTNQSAARRALALARAAREMVRAEKQAAANQLEEVKLLFRMVEERLQEASLKLYEADQQVGAVDELVTSNGMLLDPTIVTQCFPGKPLEAEIQKWGRGILMHDIEESSELAGAASSEQSPTDLTGVSPPTFDAGSLASKTAAPLSNLQEVDKSFQVSNGL